MNGRPMPLPYIFIAAILVQILLGFAVCALQAGAILLGMSAVTFNAKTALASLIIGTPFNMGGYTVRCVFERLVVPLEPWVGERTSIVFSNLWFYLALLAAQMLLVALLITFRWRCAKTPKDWGIAALIGLLMLNSLANLMWPWWGT